MLALVSQLVGRSVITFDDAQPLGVLRDPIIDPDNGKLVGYFLGYGPMHLKQGILAADDIAGYDPTRVVVHRSDVIRDLKEEPKIREILQRKLPVLAANVITESGQHLGRANDLLLDTELSMIIKYYVHSILSDRIISAEHVIAIEKRGIIVDDIATSSAAAAAEPVN